MVESIPTKFDWPAEKHPANGGQSIIAAEDKKGRKLEQPPKILLVATVFNLAYRVLRCAQAAGAEVYVLGNPGAGALNFSRCCRGFTRSFAVINGERDRNLAVEINCLAKQLGIGMVLPGCAHSTRALIAVRDLIEPPCFPLPPLDCFDLLNNKWTFAHLCHQLGIKHPATWLFPDARRLADEMSRGSVIPPLVAKPLSWSGGKLGAAGVVKIDRADDERLASIYYEPVLAQQFVAGSEIGASIYAAGGRVEAFIAHKYVRRIYSTFHDEEILAATEKIAAHLRLDGVYNFDMIRTPDNVVHFLECNPRFFFKIDLSRAAGINFVALGLAPDRRDRMLTVPNGAQVRQPEAVLATLFRHGVTNRDISLARQHLSDPAPYLLERLQLTF